MFSRAAINSSMTQKREYSVFSSPFRSCISASTLTFDPVPLSFLLPRFDECLFVVHSLFSPEREICLRLCAMAAMRTRDRRKNRKASAKTSSKGNSSYKDLGCTELHWPAEDERELSQEIVRVNPLSRCSILQAPSHKFVVSHWGKTSSLVPSGLSSSYSRSWINGPSREGCADCTNNRQENTAATKSDKHNTVTANYWMLLSDEIILAIFQFLPKKTVVKCAQVCRHWQRLAYDESLWRHVDMSKTNLLPGLLGKVLKRGTRVLRLAQAKVASPICDENVMFFSDIVPLSPKSPSESMFSLRYLDATSCSFQNDTLLCLLLHSKQLTHISLESCNVSTSILKAISELRNLEVLNLAMCTGVTITGMCSIVKGGKNHRLKQLNLAWTHLTKATILQIIKNLPKLQQINLSGCRETVTDDCIKQLVKSCPHLTHIDLSDGVLLTARSLDEILKLKHLVHLGLSRCYNIPPMAFSSLPQMKTLKTLQIYGLLNTEGIEVLRAEIPNINVNKSFFSMIARPVGSVYYGTIWGVQCKG